MIFMRREHRFFHYIFQRDRIVRMHVLDDPIQGLQVAQAALALFNIRFNHIARIALAGVTLVALFQLVGNELRVKAADRLLAEQACRFLRQRLIAEQEAGKRYLMTYRPETIRESLLRLFKLLRAIVWQKYTSDDLDEGGYKFKRRVSESEAVWPDDPRYKDADPLVGQIYTKTLSESPWTSLMKDFKLPEGMGQTVTKLKL